MIVDTNGDEVKVGGVYMNQRGQLMTITDLDSVPYSDFPVGAVYEGCDPEDEDFYTLSFFWFERRGHYKGRSG